MMSTVGNLTPRRIYDAQNICLLCAFSFIYTDILSTGEKQEVKLLKQKLRLTEERIDNVRKIIPSFNIKEVDKNSGVCVKCYKTVEKGIRMEEQLIKLKSDLNKSRQEVMAAKSRTQVEKRLLRSPFSSVQPKQPKSFPSNITLKHAIQLPSFGDILLMTQNTQTSTTTSSTTSGSVFQLQPNVQLPSTVFTTSHVQKFAAIAPAPANISLSSGKFNDKLLTAQTDFFLRGWFFQSLI